MRQRIAMFVVLSLTWCAGVAANVTLAEVEKMEALWKGRNVESYSFSPGLHSFGASRDPRVRVYVKRSKVTDIRFLHSFDGHKSGSRISVGGMRKLAPFPLTVEDAFDALRSCIAEYDSLLSVDFHEELGVPLYWTCGELETDGWWGAEIKELEVGTPPNKHMQRAGEP
jgi:hypothetical protein